MVRFTIDTYIDANFIMYRDTQKNSELLFPMGENYKKMYFNMVSQMFIDTLCAMGRNV